MTRKMMRARAWAIGPVALGVAVAFAAPAAAKSPKAKAPARHFTGPVVVSPLPGAPVALPRTQISFLGAAIGKLSRVSVVGSKSGRHSGRLRAYGAVTGTSFLPFRPFKAGEKVSVSARLRVSRTGNRAVFTHFTVASPAPVVPERFAPVPGTPSDLQSFQSRPDLQPPVFTVTTPATGAASAGNILTTPALGPGQHGPQILDRSGNLLWSRPLSGDKEAEGLKVQRYRGKPVLTWWEGQIIKLGYGYVGQDIIADSNYHTVAHVRAGNGLQTDGHEFLLTPQGTAIIMAYSPVRADLSSAGGPTAGVAVEGVLQEIDIKTGLVMWEWHSLGNVSVADSYSKPGATANAPFDYFHINSAFADTRGNVIISARNTWGIYSINRRTGRLNWRLNGKRSTFAMGAGTRFAYQHDAQLHGNTLTLFDDEGGPVINGPSRGEVIKLDFAHKRATLVQQFIHTPPLQTFSQGNLQRLSNGNWFLGWGGLPNITEFSASGEIVFDGRYPKGENSYRAYRAAWTGQPRKGPTAVIAPGAGGAKYIYASWNGATEVAAWQVLAGSSPSSLSPVSKMPRTGFETAAPLPAATTSARVQALSSTGKVLGTSKVASG